MIRSHISSTQECGVVLKLEMFSHLSSRSFGLCSPIRLEALSLTLLAGTKFKHENESSCTPSREIMIIFGM